MVSGVGSRRRPGVGCGGLGQVQSMRPRCSGKHLCLLLAWSPLFLVRPAPEARANLVGRSSSRRRRAHHGAERESPHLFDGGGAKRSTPPISFSWAALTEERAP